MVQTVLVGPAAFDFGRDNRAGSLPSGPPPHILPVMTIVTDHHRPKRARRKKREQEFPPNRVVAARKPKPEHYGEIKYGGRTMPSGPEGPPPSSRGASG
jgi:hypothetical protein